MKRYIHVYFLLTGFSYFSLFPKTISPVARFSDCPRFRGCKSEQPRRIRRSSLGLFNFFLERLGGTSVKGEPEGECEQRTTEGRTADNGRCTARDSELRITDDGCWINFYFICVLFNLLFLLHHFNNMRTE